MRKHIHVHIHRTLDAWVESEHPRGQPGNAGQFSSGGSASTTTKPEATRSSSTKSTVQAAPRTTPQKAKPTPRSGSQAHSAAVQKSNDQIARVVETYNNSKKTTEDKHKALTEISHSIFNYMGLHQNVKFQIKEPYNFMVGDKQFTTGGWFSGAENKVTICSTENPTNPYLAGLVCHESMHAKFHAVEMAYMDESDKIFNDEVHGNKDILKPDDSIREEFQSEFPVHTALHNWPIEYNKQEELSKDDGITDYSRAYWDAVKQGTGDKLTAINETLAEMAKLDHEGSLPRLLWYKNSKSFKPLYQAINKLYPQVAGALKIPEKIRPDED